MVYHSLVCILRFISLAARRAGRLGTFMLGAPAPTPPRLRGGVGAGAGFTLLEMLVVVAIISVIIGVVVVNQRSFDNSIILSNTAYDVALSVREAQAYGHAGHGVSGSSSLVTYGTGIDFTAAQKRTYILFADTVPATVNSCYTTTISGSTAAPQNSPAQKTGDCIYTSSGTLSDASLRTFTINNEMYISNLCATYTPSGSSAVTKCSSPSNAFKQLDITSARADVSTHIYISGGTLPSPQSADSACIEISSPDGKAHERITVSKVGTIFVERKKCL